MYLPVVPSSNPSPLLPRRRSLPGMDDNNNAAPPPPEAPIATPPVGKASRKQPVQYSGFFPPGPLNVKYVSSNFIKTDMQTMAGRMAANGTGSATLGTSINTAKRRRVDENGDVKGSDDGQDDDDDGDENDDDDEMGRASRTIVIHPGSTHIRVGLASDVSPVVWPNVLARRYKVGSGADKASDSAAKQQEAPSVSQDSPPHADPSSSTPPAGTTTTAKSESLDANIALIRADLRSIMRNMKLRGVSNGRASAANYNATVQPETIPSHNDLDDEWTPEGQGSSTKADIEFGERALKLASLSPKNLDAPASSSHTWKLFRPIQRGRLHRKPYRDTYKHAAEQVLSSDMSRILSAMISTPREDLNRKIDSTDAASAQGKTLHGLGIPRRNYHLYSVILIVPDLFPPADVRLLVQVLLQDLAFSQLIVQQESTAATFGAGMSSACVVHLGGQRASIACVDEGLLLQDTRVHLGYGGQDVTDFLYKLLLRANLPYKECDPHRRLTDQLIMEDLKKQMITLDVTQIGLYIFNFLVRFPATPTRKYEVRVYDEAIVAPMLFFGIGVRVLEGIAEKQDEGGESEDSTADDDTAMDEEEEAEREAADLDFKMPVTQAMTATVKHLLPPVVTAAATAAAAAAPTAPAPSKQPTPSASSPPPPSTATDQQQQQPSSANNEAPTTSSASRETSAAPASAPAPATPSAPTMSARTRRARTLHHAAQQPLDFSLMHSLLTTLTAGGTSPAAAADRLRKLASNILVIGGSARIKGVGAALEARLANHLEQHYANGAAAAANGGGAGGATNAAPPPPSTSTSTTAPSPTVIPPPRDIDPTLLAWKGMAVLPRLDSASEMWFTRAEWDVLGWRGFKDRSLFL